MRYGRKMTGELSSGAEILNGDKGAGTKVGLGYEKYVGELPNGRRPGW